MSTIFYHNPAQKKLAEQTLKETEKATGAAVYTLIRPFTDFTEAEDYHQKYSLKNNPIFMRELKQFYSDEKSLTGSTAAARINGYLAGNGTLEELQKEVDTFGLSAEGKKRLLSMVKSEETAAGEPGKVGKFLKSVLSACGLAPKSN